MSRFRPIPLQVCTTRSRCRFRVVNFASQQPPNAGHQSQDFQTHLPRPIDDASLRCLHSDTLSLTAPLALATAMHKHPSRHCLRSSHPEWACSRARLSCCRTRPCPRRRLRDLRRAPRRTSNNSVRGWAGILEPLGTAAEQACIPSTAVVSMEGITHRESSLLSRLGESTPCNSRSISRLRRVGVKPEVIPRGAKVEGRMGS